MATVKKEVEVSKEMSELISALATIVTATRQSLKDGFQPGSDIPAVVMAAWSVLPGAIQGLDQLGAEAKSLDSFIAAIGVGGSELASAALKPLA